jgi:hypothetical protein
VKRIVNDLQCKGYVTWFDLHNMKVSCNVALLLLCSAVVFACVHVSVFLLFLTQSVCARLSSLVAWRQGSTVDAMSDAVDNAEIMLSCIGLAYKESANCRE